MSQDVEKPIPRAIYRLQFNKDFGFAQATELAAYLARLGVSHVYASPHLAARPGSTHGYDIVDHNALNPEIGSRDDLDRMVCAFRREGLGQVLDFVPNHMGVGGSDNRFWLDVLEWGPDSRYAGYFDIDWAPDRRDLQDKVLVPFLGDQYGAVLHAGHLVLTFDAEDGCFAVWAYESHKLPVCPLDYGRIPGDADPVLERLGDAFAGLPAHRPHIARRAAELKAELAGIARERPEVREAIQAAVNGLNGRSGEPESFRRLHDLIQRQHWRAAYFRVAADDINYRRFFNINVLYQLLVGAWPAELTGVGMPEPGALEDFTTRLAGAMIKSVREAKAHSTWAAPNQAYEEAFIGFLRDALDVIRSNAFLDAFLPFQERVTRLGVLNSLVQTVLKLTVPGVPDIYQGAELWDLSMVDPDNRRPVDYGARMRQLDEVEAGLRGDRQAAMAALPGRWRDGAVKLAVVAAVLAHRRDCPDLYARGRYEPLEADGGRSERVCAFTRRKDDRVVLVVAARFPARGEAAPEWEDTAIPVLAARWTDLLTGRTLDAPGGGMMAEALFRTLPVAVLVPVSA